MKPSIRLGKVLGVDIGVHYSWFAVMALVSWSLADGFLPRQFPGWATLTYWLTGVAAALLLFGSVLVHEMAHSLVAKARGFPVQGITLFLLGGVSNVKAESRRARDEFAISVVGPLTSLAISFVFGAGLWALKGGTAHVWYLTAVDLANSPAAAVVWYVALVNLMLAAFNILPAFPLDGGRVLRASIWAATGSFQRATSVAARGGQAVGILVIALGALQVLNGFVLQGLWLAFIGWFLNGAAGSSLREVRLEAGLRGASVKDVMDTDPPTIGPDVTIADAMHEHFLPSGGRAVAVCVSDRVAGIITLADVRHVPMRLWTSVRVGEKMTAAPLKHVAPDDELSHALSLLGQHAIHQAPVIEGGRLVGLVSRAHIIRYLASRGELDARL